MDVVTLAVAKKQAVSSANTYTDGKIEGLESGFDYKGSVASVEDLPMSGNQKGDEYTIADGSGSYAWNGTSWDRAGAQGPEGPQGEPGEQGIPGRDGAIQYAAGTGIEITDDHVINNTQTSAEWGNIDGDIEDQEDLMGKFDEIPIVEGNSTDATTAKLTKLKIDETNFSLAGGGSSVYADYSAMITDLNSKAKSDLELGWNLYIRKIDVPDLWISKNDESTSVPYNYISDEQFITDLKTAAASGLQIGYYRVSQLEAEKVFIPVEDVQINGASILDDGIANIPKGSSVTYGVWKVNSANGVKSTFSGDLQISKATDAEITSKSQDYKPIVPSNLQFAVDTGVKGSTNYTSFTCEMADGTTKTLKLYSELI